MTWQDYLKYFEEILNAENPSEPYNDDEYYQYTKLNWSRSNRWLKHSPLTEESKAVVKAIKDKQIWELITEPWCGDAAHIVPIVYLLSAENPNIQLNLQLRDNGSEIDKYLTNGSKSIPILIVRDAVGKDLFHWGPRPASAKKIYEDLKKVNGSYEEIKVAHQNFYNQDKAREIQEEITTLLKS
ncbi:MAG TPA: thioredoxin family protein [Niabella sp.]|jgi:hypothetical protein|nr:thioredoxin family protein [Chitinophagaceae bacterium]HRN47338.1 thioredoxin family protein [Niabella sp.]HRO85767.1 thioredoxin family protein [Niabella sp.]HUN01997.1 thioredoxin family protein [Niabella sp.]